MINITKLNIKTYIYISLIIISTYLAKYILSSIFLVELHFIVWGLILGLFISIYFVIKLDILNYSMVFFILIQILILVLNSKDSKHNKISGIWKGTGQNKNTIFKFIDNQIILTDSITIDTYYYCYSNNILTFYDELDDTVFKCHILLKSDKLILINNKNEVYNKIKE